MKGNDASRTVKTKKSKIITAILIAVLVLVSFVGGYFSNYLFNSKTTNLSKDIVRLMDKVGYIYDPNTGKSREITEKDIADALVGALQDEYAQYYTEEEYQQIKSEAKGSYSGFGISMYANVPIVFKVMGNSPADRAGMEAGDKIIAIETNNEKKEIADIETLMTVLDGIKENESSKFFVERNGKLIDITMKKEEYKTSYVTYYDSEVKYSFRSQEEGGKLEGYEDASKGLTELDSSTGYVIFDLFEGDAAKQLKEVLEYMTERGRTKLVFDLRDNGGGYMHVLTEVASNLIYNGGKGGAVIAYSSGKAENSTFKTAGNYFNEKITAISVIANEYTASASECLIGAMLCHGERFGIERLVIEKNSKGVAKTYGKGIMQATYELISGGAFKLTTAQILWPDKTTCIHGKGILPLEENAVSKTDALSRAIQTLSIAV